MGETWSVPVIGKVKLSGGVEKYVAFVGGGYDTASNNNTGKAFFIIDLSNGSKLWEYYNNGSNDARYMNFSLAGSPMPVDTNIDGFVDRVYVGDVGGQLWKFDVSAEGTVSGGVVTNWTGKRLFSAASTQTNPPASGAFYPAQAMYGSPVLAYDSQNSLWVFIGTGDRNNPNRASSNRFYAIKDNTTMANGSMLTESSLADVTSSGSTTITQGWYLRLAANEKVLDTAEVFDGTVFFTTYTPATADDDCETEMGPARLYGVSMANGQARWPDDPTDTERSHIVGDGIPSRPTISKGGTHGAVLAVGTTGQEVAHEELDLSTDFRVRYWREVLN
jgi:type IV pilus assembly protein PilY1